MSEETAQNPPQVVGVSFRRGGRVYYFAPNGIRVNVGDYVLARTERGVDLGEVVSLRDQPVGEDAGRPLKPLVRRATRDDQRREERLREREREAAAVCERKIAEHGLPMKLIGADYTFDGQRLTFYFSAEGRVDFRALVRDLAETFHCRIELRQVGVRDEAKMVGGLGPCGRPLCCAQWLRTFDPVGIKVAKDQGLSLNPAKISGICDRLMCCLRFEQEVYHDLAARLPQVGDQVKSQGRLGRVSAVALLRERVTVEFRDGEILQTLEIPAQDLRRARGYWLHVSGPSGGQTAAAATAGREARSADRMGERHAPEKRAAQHGPDGTEPDRQAAAEEARRSARAGRRSRRPTSAVRPETEAAGRDERRRRPEPPEAAPATAAEAPPTDEPAAQTGERRSRRRAWRRTRPRRGAGESETGNGFGRPAEAPDAGG